MHIYKVIIIQSGVLNIIGSKQWNSILLGRVENIFRVIRNTTDLFCDIYYFYCSHATTSSEMVPQENRDC